MKVLSCLRNTFILFVLFQFCGLPVVSQNILPFEWKISFSDTLNNPSIEKKIDAWKNVNLLLSWERQGYFWQNGRCCISTDFKVPRELIDSTFSLKMSLQCDVKAVYVNGIYIIVDLKRKHWSDKSSTISVALPMNCLKLDKKNRIEIEASNLSYTGGISHNYCSISPQNNLNNSTVKIQITEVDHVFVNKKPKITVKIKSQRKGVLLYCVKNDFHETLVKSTIKVAPTDSSISIDLSNKITKPGFYECVATLNTIGYAGDVQWLAVSPERIKCSTDTVIGFLNYWNNALNELHAIPPDFKIHKVDSLSKGLRDGYVIEMKSIGDLTIRGYYFVPRNPGNYPALLHLPGYGVSFRNVNKFLKREENVVELALCVRGHGISNDVFNPGFGIPGIWGYKLYSENENAYRAVYIDCVRAVEFLISRPEVDSTRIGVLGASQGGGLALVTAGLCKNKIAACAYFDPFPCDIKDFVNIRQLCKTELQTYLNYYHNSFNFEQAMVVQELINTKGFANWITCPTFYGTGLFDDDCPPHVGFAAYNAIKSKKQYKVYPYDSHLGESNYEKDFMLFFKKELDF